MPEIHFGLQAESSGDDDRNADCDGLLVIDCEEVYMETLVGDGMPLQLVEHCLILLLTEVEVDDESLGSIGSCLKLLCVYCEDDILDAVAIKIAGNEALAAESLENGFVTHLTDLTVKFKMLHFAFV